MDTKSLIHMLPPMRILQRVGILAEKQDYNHRLMNVPAMWSRTMGAGVKIAILDTGLPKHVDLDPKGGKSFIRGYLQDFNGHSTHVAGLVAAIANNGLGVAGIAPDVDDYYGAVLNASGDGSIDDIVRGIYWAVDDIGADIISMSLGVQAGFITFKSLERACDYAVSKGVTVFAAAGNESGKVGQPACYDSVIAVAACDSKGTHANFSNTGPEVDLAAGGVNVYSTYLNNTYVKMSGTSMACPAAAAIGALIKSDHRKRGEELSPAELKDHMQRIAFDVGPDGFDELWGHGIPIFRKGPDPYDTSVPVDDPPDPAAPQTGAGAGAKFGIRSNCSIWRLVYKYVGRLNTNLHSYPTETAVKITVNDLAGELTRVNAHLNP